MDNFSYFPNHSIRVGFLLNPWGVLYTRNKIEQANWVSTLIVCVPFTDQLVQLQKLIVQQPLDAMQPNVQEIQTTASVIACC